jgi:hypothetical protein
MALRAAHYCTREQAARLAVDHRSLAAGWRMMGRLEREAWHWARARAWQRYAEGGQWAECLHSEYEQTPWLGQAA